MFAHANGIFYVLVMLFQEFMSFELFSLCLLFIRSFVRSFGRLVGWSWVYALYTVCGQHNNNADFLANVN